MKRLLACAMAVALLAALAAPAMADVMWEPYGNQFYDRHRGECGYENRGYYANGAEGYVTAWEAPGGVSVRGQVENGQSLWVYYTWEDWGLVNFRTGDSWVEGWVPMSELRLRYDYICFQEEYGDQFQPYGGQFADYDGTSEGIQLWEYPGAWEPKIVLEENEDFLKALVGTADDASYISQVYTDPQGDTWGFVGYMYGLRNFWICLDNPKGEGVMTSCVPETDALFASGELIPAQTPRLPAKGYIPYALVAAVAAGTAAVLAVYYRKKKKT